MKDPSGALYDAFRRMRQLAQDFEGLRDEPIRRHPGYRRIVESLRPSWLTPHPVPRSGRLESVA